MSCDGCPLQSIADLFPRATTELTIWHEGNGTEDRVMLSVTHAGEQFRVDDCHCRTAVAKMSAEMDVKRQTPESQGSQTLVGGDCRLVWET